MVDELARGHVFRPFSKFLGFMLAAGIAGRRGADKCGGGGRVTLAGAGWDRAAGWGIRPDAEV